MPTGVCYHLANWNSDKSILDYFILRSRMPRQRYILDEKLRPYDCGFVLQKSEKGKALCTEINAWLGEMRESGELDRLLKKWTERPESERTVPDYKAFPAP